MFKGFQKTIGNNYDFRGFPNLTFGGLEYAYGFSSCYCWFDPSYGILFGSNIASWTDRIGNYQANQSNASTQPVFVTSLASFNSKPAIKFLENSSVSQYFNMASAIPMPTNYTIAVVFQSLGIGNSLDPILCTQSSGDVVAVAGGSSFVGFGVYYCTFSSDPTSISTVFATSQIDSSAHIMIITPTFIMIDGVVEVTGSFTWSGAIQAIGGFNNVASANAYLGDILFYSRSFSQADALTLSNNIDGKYAIY